MVSDKSRFFITNQAVSNTKPAITRGAISDFDLCIAADSTKKLSAYYERGLAKVKIGEFQSAILDFDIYIVMLPSDENGYVNRGYLKNKLNDTKAAFADLNKAIDLNPRNALAYQYRGNIKTRL